MITVAGAGRQPSRGRGVAGSVACDMHFSFSTCLPGYLCGPVSRDS